MAKKKQRARKTNGAPTNLPAPELLYDPDQFRVHTDQNERLIRRSLEEVGPFRSIGVDGNNTVRAGNGVLKQARDLGLTITVIDAKPNELIAVRRKDLKGKKAIRAAIFDNRTAETSHFDMEKLTAFGEDLTAFEFEDLENAGGPESGTGELLELVHVTRDEPKTDVQTGYIFQMGEHILACLNPVTDWPLWMEYLEEGFLLLVYPGVLACHTLRSDAAPGTVLVQPDPYICGHIVDRYRELCPKETVKRLDDE